MKNLLISFLLLLAHTFQKEKEHHTLTHSAEAGELHVGSYRRLVPSHALWKGDNQSLYEVTNEFPVKNDEVLDQLIPGIALFNQSVAVVWQDVAVRGRILRKNGTEKGAQFSISNHSANIVDYSPSIASSDQLSVTWAGLTMLLNAEVYLERFDQYGKAVGSSITIASYPLNTDLMQTDIVTLPNGYSVIAWTTTGGGTDQKGYHVYTESIHSNGNRLGILQVSNYTSLVQQAPKLAKVANSNHYLITWESQRQNALDFFACGSIISFNQTIIVPEFLVSTKTLGDQRSPTGMSLSDGSLLVGWDHYSTSYGEYLFFGQFFYANGSKRGSNVQLLGRRGKTSHTTINLTYLKEAPPSMTLLGPHDDFLIVFHNSSSRNGDIYGQVFSSVATPIGSAFLLNDYLNNDQVYPILDSSNGTITVIWISNGQGDLQEKAIYGKTLLVGREGHATHYLTSTTIDPTTLPSLIPTANTQNPTTNSNPPTIALQPIDNLATIEAHFVNNFYVAFIPLSRLFYHANNDTYIKNITFIDRSPLPSTWRLNRTSKILNIPSNVTVQRYNLTIFIVDEKGGAASNLFSIRLMLPSYSTTYHFKEKDKKLLTFEKKALIFGSVAIVILAGGGIIMICRHRRRKRSRELELVTYQKTNID